MTSNKQVRDAVVTLENYFSVYSGEEVDDGIRKANEVNSFVQSNIAVPTQDFTGDYLRYTLTTLTRDMWLTSIICKCVKPFSESVGEVAYEIATSNGITLVALPQEIMTTEGLIIEFYVDRLLPLGTEIDMVCTSTKAYGQVQVKLNFN